jgi:hypothetical protein
VDVVSDLTRTLGRLYTARLGSRPPLRHRVPDDPERTHAREALAALDAVQIRLLADTWALLRERRAQGLPLDLDQR